MKAFTPGTTHKPSEDFDEQYHKPMRVFTTGEAHEPNVGFYRTTPQTKQEHFNLV